MGLNFLDAALRGGAGTLFALLTLFFLREWRVSQTARLGALTCAGAVSYIGLVAIDASGPIVPERLPLHLMSLATPGLFWLFAQSWFDDEFRLRPWHVAVVVVLTIAGFAGNYLFFTSGSRYFFVAVIWRTFSIGLTIAAIVAALRGRNGDLVESRRRARLLLSLVIAAAILMIVLAELPLRGWPPPLEWRVVNALGLFLLATTVALTILGWRDPALVAPPMRVVAVADVVRSEADDSLLLGRLDSDMRHERLYRQDGLTITAVAARLGVPEYRLRRAINQGLGARNFNAYLNGFRLAEAEEALADPAQRDVPILTIAMDAGFGSLAPFNRAFRTRLGCTPTEYRARY